MKGEYVVCRPIANHYLIRERDRRRVRELAAVGAAVLLVGAALLAYTWVHSEIVRTGYRSDELEGQLRDLATRERQLRLEAAFLSNPESVYRRASAELGMGAPTVEQMIFAEELE